MPMPSFDVAVIGAGPNGLAAAARLAGKGLRVLILERAPLAGGGAGPGLGEGAPLAHLVYNLDPRVERGMHLARHGLVWQEPALATTALSETGDHIRLEGSFGERLQGASAGDRAAFAALRARLMGIAAVLAPLRQMPPPRLSRQGNDWLALARIGLKARMQGREALREMLRMLLTNVHDAVTDEISSPLLRGVIAFDAVLGSWLGPCSPNSLLPLLDRLAGQTAGRQGALGLPAGGPPALADAMARSAVAAGATLRTGVAVTAIRTDGDAVQGVTLSTGEEVEVPLVVSAIAPQATLLRLVGPRWLDAGLVTALRHRRARGAAARLNLTLAREVDFRGADPRSRLVIAPSPEAIERAFNAVKYGQVPAAPVMEVLIPSAFAGGTPRLSIVAQYAPHAPADPEAARRALLQGVVERLEAHAPGLKAAIEHTETLLPQDIAARWGLVQWHHLELSAEQMLFLRPTPDLARYRTPIRGLWLASAGSHPGGGIGGSAGWNAAGAMLEAGR